jgi:hypothetical protein
LTLLDGSFISIPSGEIHRMHVPNDVFIHGSVGQWLLLRRLSGKLELMNPFSKNVIKLPKSANPCPTNSILYKLVSLSTPQDLSLNSLFVVLTTSMVFKSVISICRPSASIAFRVPDGEIRDIIFCDGKLYALSSNKLFVLEIGSSYQGKPSISSMKCVSYSVKNVMIDRSIDDKSYHCVYWSYLAEYNGKLFQVRRLVGFLSTLPTKDRIKNTRTFSFEILELDMTINSPNKWRRLDTLGDQALFVGTNTKFLPASECGAQKDCIYFVCDDEHGIWDADLFRDSGVFNMRNGTITPLLLDKPFVRPRGYGGCPTWFFPTALYSSIV